MLKDIREQGFQVVAASADRPEKVAETRTQLGLGFPTYSDASLDAAKALGIAWKVGDEILEKYAEYGIDLEEASGHDHHLLPVPGVLVTKGGVILYHYIHPDHTHRLPTAVLLAMVEAARRESSAVEV